MQHTRHTTARLQHQPRHNCITYLGNDDPDSNEVVGESSKEGLTVGRPGEGGALWLLGLFGEFGREVGFEVVNNGPGC